MPIAGAKAVFKRFWKRHPYNKVADKEHQWTVPDGKIWEVQIAMINASQSATRYIRILDPNEQVLGYITGATAGTGFICGPALLTTGQYLQKPIILYEGFIVDFIFGASQTSTDVIFLSVLEYNADEVLKE